MQDENFRINVNEEYFLQIYKNNIGPFDIYFYINEEDNIYIPWDKNRFSKDIIFPLKKVYFENEYIYIPYNSIQFCEIYYGKDWRTPKQKKNSINFFIFL